MKTSENIDLNVIAVPLNLLKSFSFSKDSLVLKNEIEIHPIIIEIIVDPNKKNKNV